MNIKNKLTILFITISVFCVAQTSFAKESKWNGTWTYPSRHGSSTLEISKHSGQQFNFELFAMNGANMGEISGIAKISGNKAYFDDKLSKDKDIEPYGCKVTFINKGNAIDVKTTEECSSYAGNAVYFDKEYKKGKNLPNIEQSFVQRKIFPDKKTDDKFKKLTGKDYETFMDAFHLVFEEEDLDKLNTKVFAGCVRGICPWLAGIIMFDKKGNFYAMILAGAENVPEDSLELSARYYTNNKSYAEKLPLTIKKWYEQRAGTDKKVKIVYKNEK